MLATRTIVVPPFKAAGTLAFAGVGGMLLSGVVLAAEAVPWGSSQTALMVRGAATLVLGFLGPLALLGFFLARRANRRWLTLLAGVAAGTAFPIAMTVMEVARGSPSTVSEFFDPALLIVIPAGAAIGGIVCLTVHWFVRTFLFTVIEDDGSYCLRCGYQIGAPTATPLVITICPECGAARGDAHHEQAGLVRLFDRARRAARPALAILAVATVVAVSVALYRAAPVTRFLARFGALTGYRNQVGGQITDWAMAGRSAPVVCEAAGAILRLNDGAGTVLVVRYAPDPPPGLPPMQIMLALETKGPGGNGIGFGAPYVICDLDGEQAEHVIRHGVPAGLLAEFQGASTRGWIGKAGNAWPPAIVRIDPAAFVPARAADW